MLTDDRDLGTGGEEEQPGLQAMTLVEHLGELRNRLTKAILAVAAGGIVVFLLYNNIVDWLLQPYCDIQPENCTLYVTTPLEGFSARLKLAGYGGLILGSPVVLWQLWRFITPGLHPKEKRYAIPFIAASVLLFATGGTLAVITFPRALEFLAEVAGRDVQLLLGPAGYIGFILGIIIAFGIAFEFPILLTFLLLAGVLTTKQLRGFRRYAAVIIFAAAAIITPSQDPYSLFLMAGPMVLFYEASILIGRILKK